MALFSGPSTIPCAACDELKQLPAGAVIKNAFYACGVCDKFHRVNYSVYVMMTVQTAGASADALLLATTKRPCPKCANPASVHYDSIDWMSDCRIPQYMVCSNKFCRRIVGVD